MAIGLSERDERMLRGEMGEGVRLAMRIVVRMAGVAGADELMDVTQAHIDGCGLLSEAGLEFAETLAAKGARVSIPTTLNMGPLDLQQWREFGIDEAFAAMAIRQAKAYEGMGCVPTWTCAPYQGYLTRAQMWPPPGREPPGAASGAARGLRARAAPRRHLLSRLRPPAGSIGG